MGLLDKMMSGAISAVKKVSNKITGKDNADNDEHIKVYGFIDDLIGDNYKDVKEALETYGFTNISFVAKKDLKRKLKKNFFSEDDDFEDGEVELISINGDVDFDKRSKYLPTAKVVITYHTYKNANVEDDESKYIKVSNFIDDLIGDNYKDAKEALEAYGFTNITFAVKRDLKANLKKRLFFSETNDYEDGEVELISINGEVDFDEDDCFLSSDRVVITYHTYQNAKVETVSEKIVAKCKSCGATVEYTKNNPRCPYCKGAIED